MPYVGGIWYSMEMYAVFDKTRVSEEVIARTNSPYSIWNNPRLRGSSPNDPAWVLGTRGSSPNDPAWVLGTVDQKTLDKLLKDPTLVVKKVYCGN